MISNTCKYAIRAVIYLSLFASEEKKSGIKEISSELGIPTPFLGKILQMLTKQNILNSAKGPHGGFSLKRPAIDISLMDIIEIIDGTDYFNTCIIRTTKCEEKGPCSIHDKVAPLHKGLKTLFMTETIADLASEFRNDKERIRI
ncbi:MAG: Rrf2 family transcriptional regulator [Bacteroidota bacterium]